MISYIKGKVLKKNEKGIILNTGNIGYFINLNNNLLSEITETQEVEYFIHSHIREDCFDLYGFQSPETLDFFKQLISINGIGPKVGLEICNLDSDQIKNAILNEDVAFITTIPGIGKKTAQRIILELKNKISLDSLEKLPSASSNSQNEDIISALIDFGYQRKHIIQTLKDSPPELQTEQEIITYFLKNA